MFNSKNILITGGTGSFGVSLIKKLVKSYKPRRIIIYSRDELKQFELSNQLKNLKTQSLRFLIGDVRDKERLNLALKGVDYVFHAAALKQVPAAEYNPMECIKTNIIGANNIIECAINNNVKKLIALSTDKAANPINLYGASKLASDKLFVAANNLVGSSELRFSVVRYGNVVGSRGSVVHEFKKKINNGDKFLPITHKDMTRFWITLDQGIDFSIQSMKLMKGGEIFVPKLPSIKVTDLAISFRENIKFKFIGIRPGEKIHEIMCPSDDSHRTIEFKKYFIITPTILMRMKFEDYITSKDREKGKIVKPGYEYNSGNNPEFLSVKEIKKINKLVLR
jgi:UDP-N-acetylglucosamine 4,6-dehydratase/5-epimerase